MDEEGGMVLSASESCEKRKKLAGWKAMPFIIGNETFERLATFGLMSNFMVYLQSEYHMDQVEAATIINVWNAVANFAPVFGAFISDARIGKFRTIVFGSIAELLGMVILTLTALIPQLRPPPCTAFQGYHHDQNAGGCVLYTQTQLAVLLLGLLMLSVGTGGIRPCSVPFSIDQFDSSSEEGQKGIRSFFSWYYTTHTIVLLISQTLVVYVQNDISWAIGFAIPTVFMLMAIALFFVGTKMYVYVEPEGSVISGAARVFVEAYKKRRLRLSDATASSCAADLYGPLLESNRVSDELLLTDQFSVLNKAAIVTEADLDCDCQNATKRRFCSVQEIEDVKCILSVIPVFLTSIICLLPMNQTQTFTVSQALKMDLRVPGTQYQIPAGSLSVVSLVTIGLWLPFWDTVLVSRIKKFTKQEGGFTLLQKVGAGHFFAILTMYISGYIEKNRRDLVLSGVEMSVFWLSPALVLMGFFQVFSIVGLNEFFNKEVPEGMRSVGNSLLYLALSGASYASTLVIDAVQNLTGKFCGKSWLTDDVNNSRLDYFYYLIAVLTAANFMFFLVCVRGYRYRNM